MKYRKIRFIVAIIVSIMPINKLRCLLYKTIFGYRINHSTIGWGTIIFVNSINLDRCRIGRKNKFIGPMDIVIEKNASIGTSNIFNCGWWITEERFDNANYASNLKIEENTLITNNHYIDVAGSFTLSKKSWIAGSASQFWTHGAGVSDRDIFIGENCYIGSAVRFTPGTSIGNNTLVGLGSVLTKKISTENVIIAGQPAKIIKKNYDWKTHKNLTTNYTTVVK